MRHLIEGVDPNSRDVPVRALLISPTGEIVQEAQNAKEDQSDPTAHAEIEVIRRECRAIGDWRLEGYTMVVLLEPCVMCSGAIVAARLSRLVFGAWDLPAGGSGSRYDLTRDKQLGQPLEVLGGALEKECSSLLQNYFETLRSHG